MKLLNKIPALVILVLGLFLQGALLFTPDAAPLVQHLGLAAGATTCLTFFGVKHAVEQINEMMDTLTDE